MLDNKLSSIAGVDLPGVRRDLKRIRTNCPNYRIETYDLPGVRRAALHVLHWPEGKPPPAVHWARWNRNTSGPFRVPSAG